MRLHPVVIQFGKQISVSLISVLCLSNLLLMRNLPISAICKIEVNNSIENLATGYSSYFLLLIRLKI